MMTECDKCQGRKWVAIPGSHFRGGPVELPCPDCSPFKNPPDVDPANGEWPALIPNDGKK